MKLLILLIALVFTGTLYAQDSKTIDASLDSIIADQRVTELLNKHIEYNALRKGAEGFRVQIYFDSGNNSRETAFQLRSDVMAKYPDLNIYVIWQQPNYKVRVGDCLTKAQAQGILDKMEIDYKNAFIVEDVIETKTIIQD